MLKIDKYCGKIQKIAVGFLLKLKKMQLIHNQIFD